MQHPGFFDRSGPFGIAALATQLGIQVVTEVDRKIADIKTLQDAGPEDATFYNNPSYLPHLETTKAGLCLISAKDRSKCPEATFALVVPSPYEAFASLLRLYYPGSDFPSITQGLAPGELISSSAEIEDGAFVEPGVIVGPEAKIGKGARICAGAIIGYRCTVGRNSFIGPRVTLMHTLLGDNVTIHAGACIGQDGFGYAMGPQGHKKIPQVGRVIIQDDVDVGANTTIDRGALNDTIIGQGTKIDNLVQIGHNVVIGRHCVIVAYSGIAGSAELGDFVVMAARSGVAGHLKIGDGAQLAGASHAIADVPAGAKVAGTPAIPFRQFAKEQVLLRRLVAGNKK